MTELKDMIGIIYEALKNNPTIAGLTKTANGGYRIKKYDYPETSDQSRTFILIQPLAPPISGNSASDIDMQIEFTFQIAVESPDRKEAKLVQHEIKEEMQKLNYGQMTDGLDEYFETTGHFVDARRYRGNTNLYDTIY